MQIKKLTIKCLILVLAFSFTLGNYSEPSKIQAATLTDLQKQAELYRQQIAATKAATEKKKQDAALLNQALGQISSDINVTQKRINDAEANIKKTNDEITSTQKQIDAKQKELEYQQYLQQEAVRMLYIYGGDDPMDMLLANKSITAVIEQNNYLESLEAKIELTISDVNNLKKDLENQKSDLEKEKGSLELYKSQQLSNKQQLDGQKSQKNQLLNSTNQQINTYISDINDMQKKVVAVQKQIDTLVATSAWGSDIVSSNDSSWYYSQLNYSDKMGNSPYTVAQYGCLITSISMVATYWGHRISPADIAADNSLFNSEGYYLQNYPNYLGVHLSGYGSVNWGTVNDDLSNGDPVIVSVYLPSVGKVNSDGSSHFIVLKSFSNGKYMMHDPIGAGRGYAISQVRSMLRLRPN